MSKTNAQAGAHVSSQEGQMGKWAPYYDLTMTLMTLGREKKLRQSTIKLSQLKPGDKVLEIGCGTGTLTIAAKAQVGSFGEASGIDLAPEMVAVARRKAARKGADISFQQGSIASIPFPDNRFDVVMCSFMIFHMPEDVREKGIIEIYRVLKPDGHLFIIDSEPVDRLAPILQKKAFTEIETGETKFIVMRLFHLRGRVQKHEKDK